MVYKDVPNQPGYRVGDNGEVQSCWQIIHGGRGKCSSVMTDEWYTIKPATTKEGFQRIGIGRNNERSHKYVHDLVLEAFVGIAPEGLKACHINDNRTDNRLENLKWGTPKKRGIPVGEKCNRTVLTEEQVIEIRKQEKLYHKGVTQLAKEYGVGTTTISAILNNHTWKHLLSEEEKQTPLPKRKGGTSKLTPENVRDIKERYSKGETQRKLAKEFHVKQSHISRIVLGVEWKDEGGPVIRPPSNHKLTAELAQEIREKHLQGEPPSKLAEEYGVSEANISLIVNNKAWVA